MLLSATTLLVDRLTPLVVLVDLLLLGAFVADYLRTPPPAMIELERRIPARVGLSRGFLRVLALSCERARGLRLEAHEEFPAPFRVLARTVEGETVGPEGPFGAEGGGEGGDAPNPSGGPDVGIFGEGPLELARSYRSDLRGAFRFGGLRLRLRGRLGLVERQTRFEGEQEIAVEPALPGLRNTLRLAASDRWQDLGVRMLRRRGGETEFESLREYVPGDDKRRVDWKAFARRGKPMVRQYQVERGQELILMIDSGRRMRITTALGRKRGWSKLDWAIDAALQLAAVALAKGDRVGCATFDRGLSTWVVPAKGARQLTRLSQALFERQPSPHDADLARALRELAARHRRRATVILLSDVSDPLSVGLQRRALAAASGRHRLVFAALDDPGLRAAAEPVGDSEVPASVRATALELMGDRRRSLRSLATSGARVLDALPAEAAAPLLAAWLEERRRGG